MTKRRRRGNVVQKVLGSALFPLARHAVENEKKPVARKPSVKKATPAKRRQSAADVLINGRRRPR